MIGGSAQRPVGGSEPKWSAPTFARRRSQMGKSNQPPRREGGGSVCRFLTGHNVVWRDGGGVPRFAYEGESSSRLLCASPLPVFSPPVGASDGEGVSVGASSPGSSQVLLIAACPRSESRSPLQIPVARARCRVRPSSMMDRWSGTCPRARGREQHRFRRRSRIGRSSR
jgi:hypothetical protein